MTTIELKVEENEERADHDSTILVTGHSLGGAMATLFAYQLVHQRRTVELVTFGAPPAGNKDFKKAMDEKAKQGVLHSRRCANGLDPVPHSLDWHAGYYHHCKVTLLDSPLASAIPVVLEVAANVIKIVQGVITPYCCREGCVLFRWVQIGVSRNF